MAAFSEDEAYWRFLSHGPRTREQVRAFIEAVVITTEEGDGPAFWWAVEDPDTGDLIGTANIKRKEDALGSTGCTLAPSAQGKRLGVTLGWAMITLAFERFGLSKLECTCADNNQRSVHMMRDILCLTYEGLRGGETDYQGRPWPVHVFTITESEFQSKRQAISL